MRIVGGEARGRRLVAPRNTTTRPTSDFVRQAVFNVLGGIVDVEDAAVLDLFCGSGALGVEALYAGAASATFVENDRLALAATEQNIGHLGAGFGRAEVVRADVTTWLARRPPAVAGADLAFVDPPYSFAGWEAVMAGLAGVAVVVAESDREIDPGPSFDVAKVKRYGGTVVTFAQRPARPDGGQWPDPAKGAS